MPIDPTDEPDTVQARNLSNSPDQRTQFFNRLVRVRLTVSLLTVLVLSSGCDGDRVDTQKPFTSLEVTNTTLPGGVAQVPYAATLAATGGDGPYSWSLAAGALPAGLALAASGEISGTPTVIGSATFTVEIASGDGQTAQRELAISIAGWEWTAVATGLGATFSHFEIHPGDDAVWYAYGSQVPGSDVPFHVSHDAGGGWTTPFSDVIHAEALAFDPGAIDRVILGTVRGELYESTDRARTWSLIHDFGDILSITAVHVGTYDGAIYVAGTSPYRPSGLYKSHDGGATFSLLSYGVPDDWLIIPWDLEQDPVTGALFVPVEMADHKPLPYRPPLLRSLDGGASWSDVSEENWWHGIRIEIDPVDGTVYFQLEGPGLRRSEDTGNTWSSHHQNGVFLRLDRVNRHRLYLGWFHFDANHTPGGLYMSVNGGDTFAPVGLERETVLGVELDDQGTTLYAVARSQGLLRAKVPAGIQ